MSIARSKITSQGQISVPAEIRRKLGVGPGSILEWEEEGDMIFIRRSGKFTSEDIHRAIFKGRKPKHHTIEEMDEGIAEYLREKHARR
ncbi:MAG TPA: AbrB/MazE/SpoVT family DNA-binding domain-containing protein [Bryobacteraceae bacterium]|nr:AbrB/MazE/SpoVT family DNA-binding domain-containing protein [Bryobacteraceae bacterium]